jgi:nitroreductase
MDGGEPPYGRGVITVDILDVIKTRRSVRSYKDKSVDQDTLSCILEAGRFAPSAVNLQPWEFIVIRNEEMKKRVAEHARYYGYKWKHVERCQVLIVIVGNPQHKWWVVDCSLAAQNMMLEAHSLGLGTCFIGGFDEDNTRVVLRVPKEKRILGLITLGYPAGPSHPPSRIPLEKLLHHETYKKIERPPLSTKRGVISIFLKRFTKKEF